MININPKEDELSNFAYWYLTSGEVDKFFTPIKNGLLFIEGVSGIVLYRNEQFQVELFICQPNLFIPEHTHPDVDSYECFLYGMKMRDTKLLDNFKKRIEKEFKEKNLFKNLRKEVEIGANGTQQYIIKNGTNKGKIAK
jgi:hypothetical protein